MKIGRLSTAGESRSCPHCNATILKSAASCPICRHMLRATTLSFEPRSTLTTCPLLVEGTLQNPGGDPVEYQVLMEVKDDAGKLLSDYRRGRATWDGKARFLLAHRDGELGFY